MFIERYAFRFSHDHVDYPFGKCISLLKKSSINIRTAEGNLFAKESNVDFLHVSNLNIYNDLLEKYFKH